MRRIYILNFILTLLLAFAIVSFAACSPEPSDPSDPSNPSNPSDPSEPSDPSDPSNPSNPSEPSDPSTFTPDASAAGVPNRLTKGSEIIVNFASGGNPDFHWQNGYSNGGQFGCTWSNGAAKVEDGVMSMSVMRSGGGFAGAEYRTENLSGYGFYSVCMKAADCSGVISSFFGYTGEPVWDEIDIEFLGKDMTTVQFNYYTDGVGGHEFLFDLGFDASADFHEYAFDWKADGITWYVDGTAVYRATENLPSHPFQIMANVWNVVGNDDWAGAFDQSALPASAEYKWIGFSEN